MRDGWWKTTLAEVSTIQIGRTPPRDNPRYWTTDLARPFCTIADMADPKVRPAREGVTEAAEVEGKAKRVPVGSLLMSFKLTIGRVGVAAVDVFPNEAIAWIEPKTPDLDRRFLALWLESADLTTGAGRAVKGQTLNSGSLRAIPVAVPPLAEQLRIVDLAASLDAAIAASLAVTSTAMRANTALAAAAWSGAQESIVLGALGDVVTGATPQTKRPEFWEPPEIAFFTPSDFGGSLLISVAERAVSRAGATAVRPLRAPAVAQVCIGATLGKVGVLTVDCCTNQQVNAIVGLDWVDAVTASTLLATPAAQARLRSLAGQTTLPIVNKGAWSRMEIPWPSRTIRESLARVISESTEVQFATTREHTGILAVRGAILGELLSGSATIQSSYDRFLDGAA